MEIKDTGFLPEFDAGNLTQETMLKIFLSSGTRDLAIFRAVSKTWDAFISHENFKKLRLRAIVGRKDMDYLVVGGVHSKREKLLMMIKNPIDVIEISMFDFPECATGMIVVGSNNGLICLADSPLTIKRVERIVVWNPFTAEVREIRLPTPKEHQAPSQSIGIAFSSRYDFSVVRIVLLSNFPLESLVQTYSFLEDSWKDCDMIPFYTKESSSVFCINGIPFWCGCDGGTAKSVICSFDPYRNAFKKINYPPGVRPYLVHPVNFRDTVCALVMCEDYHIDMYRFDENSAKWIKKFTTGCLDEQFNIYTTRKLQCFKNIGDIVVLGFWHTGLAFHECPGSGFVPHLGNEILGFKPHWTGPFPYTVSHGRVLDIGVESLLKSGDQIMTLVTLFTSGTSNDDVKGDAFDHVGSVLVNISKNESGRKLLLDPKTGLLKQLLKQFDSTSPLRKKAVSAIVHNCCLEAENQLESLLSTAEFLWPALLLPVAGKQVYPEEETFKMPTKLGSALLIEREPVDDPKTRMEALESIYLIAIQERGRNALRLVNGQLILEFGAACEEHPEVMELYKRVSSLLLQGSHVEEPSTQAPNTNREPSTHEPNSIRD